MVGALSFLPIFLIGLTSAQCPTECELCKVFNGGEMCGPPGDQFHCEGTWNLQQPNPNPRCTQIRNGEMVNVCLYKREGDGKEFCFCDPGDIEYELCTSKINVGLCYNYTGVSWTHISEDHNDVAICNDHCLNIAVPTAYFVLGSTNVQGGKLCGCRNDAPPFELEVPSHYCDVPCPGRDTTTCGAYDVNNNHIYVNIWPTIDKPVAFSPGACYDSTTPFWIDVADVPANSPHSCDAYNKVNHNAPVSFTYFGLGSGLSMDGKECYAGFGTPPTDPPSGKLVSPYWCWGTPCPGKPAEKCGYFEAWNANRFINVWKRV